MYKSILNFISSDKTLHFLFGCAISLPIVMVSGMFEKNALLVGVIVSTIIGVVKEMFDFLDNKLNNVSHSVEFMDIIATSFGGIYVGIIIELTR